MVQPETTFPSLAPTPRFKGYIKVLFIVPPYNYIIGVLAVHVFFYKVVGPLHFLISSQNRREKNIYLYLFSTYVCSPHNSFLFFVLVRGSGGEDWGWGGSM